MGVLIKDMEKPKSCYAVIDGESEYCPFVNTDDDCVLLLKKGRCDGTWEEQYRKCPLIETAEPKWIPCSETVDIPDHEVLCCDGYGEELIGWLSYSDEQWLCESDGCVMYDPIAWREKPEPYREERRTDEQTD